VHLKKATTTVFFLHIINKGSLKIIYQREILSMKKLTLAVAATVMMASPAFAGDAAAGKAKSAMCAACHGAAGISAVPMYPNLAGQKEAYLAKQLKDFKSGNRKDPVMAPMAMALSDEDVANIAAYYAGLK
jgi:cytochrome c553|tara:strand:- start:24090 stop:24482 length:393 start_codon:yes stop_codon:yes gene_type:complete